VNTPRHARVLHAEAAFSQKHLAEAEAEQQQDFIRISVCSVVYSLITNSFEK
jgi:hypothetical protein